MLEFISNESTQNVVSVLNDMQPCSVVKLGLVIDREYGIDYSNTVNMLLRLRKYGLAEYTKAGRFHIYQLTNRWEHIVTIINQINNVSDQGRINKEV